MMEEEISTPKEQKVSKFLYVTYLFLFVWGVWAFIAYWNGFHGWPDRGYWKQLQEAARTSSPFETKQPDLQIEKKMSYSPDLL